MRKLITILAVLFAFAANGQTYKVYTNVYHGDTLYLKNCTYTYVIDSEIRYTYSNHLEGEVLVLDTIPYTYFFKTITGVVMDSVQINKWPSAVASLGFTPANSSHSHVYSSLTGIPATFTPSAHGHAYGEITGTPTIPTNTSQLTNGANFITIGSVTAAAVGLGNANNTSDANKPISTATQTALDGKQATLVSNTNIKTVGGQTLVGPGNIVTTNSQTFVPLANNFSSSSTTPAAVTGWSFAVTSGVTYRVQVIGAYQTAATTTGGIIGISLTTATGTVRGFARGAVVSTAAATELAIGIIATSGTGSTLTTTGVTAINSPHFISMDITFTCTGTGTLNIVWATEINASAAQLNQNSSLIYQALN